MKHFAVIGDPIAHSLSPTLHQEIYRQLGFEASFEKIRIQPDEIGAFMKSNQLDGFNVTIPHKQSVISYLDDLDDSAKTIGAVNCVHKQKGYNTDWVGFLKAMEVNKVKLKGKDCVILGAGGAARAIAYALIQSKVKSISVVNRTIEKANQLTQWIQKISNIKTDTHEHVSTQKRFNIIINCTPLGMWPNTENAPEFEIHPKQVLVDTIYNPIETHWLKSGKLLGAITVRGLDMFIGQGLASANIWFAKNILDKINMGKIRQILISEL